MAVTKSEYDDFVKVWTLCSLPCFLLIGNVAMHILLIKLSALHDSQGNPRAMGRAMGLRT